MNTWKQNLEETKKHYIDWWNHRGVVVNMWEHFQNGVTPHADVSMPAAPKDLNQKWFDPQWRAQYLDWYVAHSSLKADMLPVANTQLGPGSLAAILEVCLRVVRTLYGFTLTQTTPMNCTLTRTTLTSCCTNSFCMPARKKHRDTTMSVCLTLWRAWIYLRR